MKTKITYQIYEDLKNAQSYVRINHLHRQVIKIKIHVKVI